MSDSVEVLAVKLTVEDSAVKEGFEGMSSALEAWGINLHTMAREGEELLKRFGVDVEQMGSKFGVSGAQMATGLGAIAFGFEKLKDFVNDATVAWAEDETAIVKLNAAMSLVGGYTDESKTALDELATSFGLLTGNSTSSVQSLMAMGISTGRTKEQIEQMLTAASGLAVATGTTLDAAFQQLNMTFSGSIGRLGRSTPELKDLTTAELEQGGAVELLAKKYGDLSGALEHTSAVSMADFANQWEEIMSAFGEKFEAIVMPIRDSLTYLFKGFVDNKDAAIFAVSAIATALAGLLVTINPIAGAVGLVVTGLFTLSQLSADIRGPIEVAIGALVALGVATKVFGVELATATGGLTLLIGAVAGFAVAAIQAWNDANKAAEAHAKLLKGVGDAYSEYQSKIYAGFAKEAAEEEKKKKAKEATAAAAKKAADDEATYIAKLNAEVTDDQIAKLRLEEKAKEEEAKKAISNKTALAAALLLIQADYAKKEQAIIDKAAKDAKDKADREAQEQIDYANTVAKAKEDAAAQAAESQKAYDAATLASAEAAAKQRIALEDAVHAAAAAAIAKDVYLNQTAWDMVLAKQANFIQLAQQGMESLISGPFTALGEALVKHEDFWAAMGKAALKAVSTIVKGIGDQLNAMAAAKLVEAISNAFDPLTAWAAPGQFLAAGELATGAAAAYVTAGAIGAFEQGTDFAPGGVALVGEAGPELVNLPRGSQVLPAGPTAEVMAGGSQLGGNNTFVFNSPKAISPVEHSAMIKQTLREMRFQGVLR